MNFPYGELLPRIPEGFVPPEMWPEYGAVADPAELCRSELVQDNPAAVRWGIWPLYFEQYWGDEEPDLAAAQGGALAYNRAVLWRRLRDDATPRGWHKAMGRTFRVDGYQRLDDDFTARWNKNARRDLRLWQENYLDKTHRVEEISFDEYAAAYKTSLVAKREGLDRLKFMERKLSIPIARQHLRIKGVRNQTGKIVAGSGILFSPTYKMTTHLVPFITAEGARIYAATGLNYYWFKESVAQGCPKVVSTNFWHPGKPRGWKGFSEFKSHFGFEYVSYPPLLWRLARGKIF